LFIVIVPVILNIYTSIKWGGLKIYRILATK